MYVFKITLKRVEIKYLLFISFPFNLYLGFQTACSLTIVAAFIIKLLKTGLFPEFTLSVAYRTDKAIYYIIFTYLLIKRRKYLYTIFLQLMLVTTH